MALPISRSVLSLQGVTPAERRFSATLTRLDLELPRGAVALLQVDDEDCRVPLSERVIES